MKESCRGLQPVPRRFGLKPWTTFCASVGAAFLFLAVEAQAQVLIKEVISREVSIHVGGVQTPEIKEVVSREASLFIENGTPSKEVVSREVSFVVGAAGAPPQVTGILVTPSPTGDSVSLDWASYNPWAVKDVDHFDIYVSDTPFTDVTGLTRTLVVGGETVTATINGLTAFRDHYIAIVAVDVLGNRNTTVINSAAYIISPQVISREVSFFVGGEQPYLGPPLLVRGSEAKFFVPTDGSLGSIWRQRSFTPTGWLTGNTGVGFGLQPGIGIRVVKQNTGIYGGVGNLATADALLAAPAGSDRIAQEYFTILPTVNLLGEGSEGHYPDSFPVDLNDRNHYVVQAVGFIQIPVAGQYTFGLNSDDGGRIKIDGAAVMTDDTNHGPADHLGTVALTAGRHSFEVTMWEQGGGDELEFYATPGALSSWSSAFVLVGDVASGGLQAFSSLYRAGDAGSLVQTNIEAQMRHVNASVYLRQEFAVANPAALAQLVLRISYSDGFVAYFNGTEVARRNAPASLAHDSAATAARALNDTVTPESIDLSSYTGLLLPGTNVLAIQGLNDAVGDDRFLLLPEIYGSSFGGGKIGYQHLVSREVSLVVATPEAPPQVSGYVVSPSPTGDSVALDWTSYNPWAVKDVDHFDIYILDTPFTDVIGKTPVKTVGGEIVTTTVTGLTQLRDHFIAIVAVDVLGNRNTAVINSAAYILSPQVVSREVSYFVGGEPTTPYQQVISREVSFLVPDSNVPAPVTGAGSGFTAVTSTTRYRAIDLDWTAYNEPLQRDVVRYRVYIDTGFFTNVTGMTPHSYVPAGTQFVSAVVPLGNQTYYSAVVAEDALGNFNPVVAAVSAQSSVSEIWVPSDNSVTYNGAVLVNGATIRAAGTLQVDATVAAAVTRVDFFIRPSGGSDTLLASDTTPGNGFTAFWDATTVPDGAYVFTIRAFDNVGRFTELSRSVTLRFNYPPVITAMKFDGVNFADGATITRSGLLGVVATDTDGIGLAEFFYQPVGNATRTALGTDATPANGLDTPFTIESLNDGAYDLIARVYDSLGTVTEGSRRVNLLLAVPVAPTITSPANGATTMATTIQVQGSGPVNATLKVYANGVLAFSGNPAANGTFSVPVPLVEGANAIYAESSNRTGTGARSNTVTVTKLLPDAATPQASPVAGTYQGLATVTLATATAGASIRYTLDGSDPTATTGTLYAGAFVVNASATLKARAFKSGFNPSALLQVAYVIDTAGPVVSNITYNGAALANGATLTSAGILQANATDVGGVSRVEFFVREGLAGADTSLGIDTSAGDGYTAYWNADAAANGTHVFTIRAYDTFNSLTTVTRTVTLNLAQPPAPVITAPSSGLITNNNLLPVAGTAARNTTVTLRLNGTDIPGSLAVSAAGTWQTTVTLQQGANTLVARAQNRAGAGPPSAGVPVTLDTSVPNPPAAVQAGARETGRIRITWAASGGQEIRGYNLYRSAAPFNSATAAGVVRLNTDLIVAQQFDDTPSAQGAWFYRLTATNVAGTVSALSDTASAVSDSALPTVNSVTFTPRNAAHLIGGRYGTGLVDVSVQVSEPLAGVPFFSLTPSGGGFPIAVTLTASLTSTTTFTGTLQITASTGSATYQPTYSMRDLVGNRGAGTITGSNLVVDTNGPSIDTLTLSQSSPIQNDSASPVGLTVGIHLDEAPAGAPVLEWKMSRLATNQTGTPVVLAQGVDNRTWSGTFTLPAQAGLPDPENLLFLFSASDNLDNVGTNISVTSRFEVYQGSLPTLNAPPSFTAVAKPGGKIELNWGRTSESSGYQLYRSPVNGGPGSLVQLETVGSADTLTYLDQPGVDGEYHYAIATLRTANGQTVTGTRSAPPVAATADAVAPPAPQSLALVLASNGILAQWQPGTGSVEPVKFRAYRAGAPITSVSSLTAFAQNISQLHVVDPTPASAARYYAVTAVDNAGNESAPSNTAYLNATLWPVTSLTIQKTAASAPVISWTNTSPTATGYDLYNGDRATGQKLNATLLTTLTYTDASYNAGERLYSVVTLDSAQAESLPRSLLLPNVTFQLADGQTVKRGIFNRLRIVVSNLSPTNALTNAIVKLDLAGRTHQSELFNLPAGQTTEVGVVVGGYSELTDAMASTALALESRPNDGELVRLLGTGTVAVADGGLSVEVVPGKFTRGGLGDVQFRIRNNATETIEIVSAKNSGRDISPDVRFKLLDASNNLLAGRNITVNVGTGVVNLADGTSVIRIAPGAESLSDIYELEIPQTTANLLTVQFEVDRVYYRYGRPEQAQVTGATVRGSATLADATYEGVIADAVPAASTGQQPIVITGRAVSRADNTTLVPNALLRLGVSANGFERTVLMTTGPDGTFTYNFQPLAGESGLYSVWLTHPDLVQKTAQKTFVITSIMATPGTVTFRIPRNYSQSYGLAVSTGAGTSGTNLRLIPAETLPAGITVTPAGPISLSGAQHGTLSFSLLGDNTTPATGSFRLRLISDENATDGWALITVNYELTVATAAGTFTPNLLDTGVNPGGAVSENIVIKSVGVIPLQNVQLNLAQLVSTNEVPAPTWIGITTANRVGEVPVGQELPVGITIQPPANLAIGDYYFYLKFTADNYHAVNIPIHVAVTASGVGNVFFKIADLLTNTPDPNYVAPGNAQHPDPIYQGLYNARIELQNEDVPTFIRVRNADGYGEADFRNAGSMELPAGNYKYRVTVDGHDSLIGRLAIRPGISVNETALLLNRFVTVQWEVVPITIEDRYEIVLEATFETFVPAPVVTVNPPVLNLPALAAGDVYYGEFAITNHGLIRADNFSFGVPPSDAYNTYELLDTVPTSINARQTIIVPYKVTCRQSFPTAGGTGAGAGAGVGAAALVLDGAKAAPAAGGGGGGGTGGCFSYTACFQHCYTFVCAFGKPVTVCGRVCGTYYYGHCGGPAGTVTGGGGPGGAGGTIGGGGGASIDCFPNFFDCNNRNPLGCWVNYVTRQFEDEATDLEVRMPGLNNVYGRVRRFYRDNKWRFEDLEGRLIIHSDGNDTSELVLLSSSFKPVDATRLVFTNGRDRIRRNGTGWRLDAANGNWRTYDSGGKPLLSGREQTTLMQYLYDGAERLSGQATPSGQQVIWYEWTGDQITAARNAANNRVVYEHSGGRLSKVTDPTSAVTTYFYDGAGRMNKYQDATGINHNLTYDGGGAAIALLDDNGEGRRFAYAYDKLRREYYFAEKFTNGVTRESWYDQHGSIRLAKVNGQLVREVLADGRTQTIHYGEGFDIVEEQNEWGQATKVTYPDGSLHRSDYDPVTKSLRKATDRDGYITEWLHDVSGRLSELREAVGTPVARTTFFTYDGIGNTKTATVRMNDGLGDTGTTWNYDTDGHLASIVDSTGKATQFSNYDLNGRYTRLVDADNNPTTYAWDTFGRPRSAENTFGHKWLYEYDAFNNLSAEVTPRSHRTEYQYDLDNQLSRAVDPFGNELRRRFGPNGQLLEETDPGGLITRYGYDSLGRLSKRTDPAGNVTEYRFAATDIEGYRPAEIIYPTFSRRFTYDLINRTFTTEDWAGGVKITSTFTELDARGNIIAITDGLSRRRTFAWDGLGRLTRVVYPGNLAEQFTWNRFDLLTSHTSADNKTWTYEYSPNGLRSREISPEGRIRQFAYTDAGRLRRTTEANGDAQKATYDAAGRKTKMEFFSGLNPGVVERTVNFTFDEDGYITGYNDGTTSASYLYDDKGRKLAETVNYGPFSKSIGYSYTKNDLKKSFTASNGLVYESAFGPNGHLQTITLPGYGPINYSEYAVNLVAKMTTPGGSATTFAYDALLRPQAMQLKDNNGTLIFDWQTTFDSVDRIGTQRVGATTFAYAYDGYDQMTTGRGGAFTHDLRGNRTSAPALAGPWSFNNDDELQAAAGFTFANNTRGNRVSRSGSGGSQVHIYDSEGRIVQTTTNGVIAAYTYDPFGRRLSKTVNGVTTYFGYSDEGLVAEYDAAGAEIRSYGYELGSDFGQRPLWMKVGTAYYFYVFDHLGTPLRLIDSSGATVWGASYDSLGAATVLVSTVENNLRLPGQYFDAESGLHYNWNRYYDPMTGRYISRDPIGAEFNAFLYAQNNPLTKFDPDGLRVKVSLGGLFGVYTTLDGCECGLFGGRETPKIRGVKCKAAVELDLCNGRKGPWPPRLCADVGCSAGPCNVQLIKACHNFGSGENTFNGPAAGCDWKKKTGPNGPEFKVGGKTPPLFSNQPRGPFWYPSGSPN